MQCVNCPMAPSSIDGTIESDARAFVNLFYTLSPFCTVIAYTHFSFRVMHIAHCKVAKRKTNPLLQSKCRKEPKEKEKVRQYRTFTIISSFLM